MRGHSFVEARLTGSLAHGQLKGAFQQMMPAFNARVRVQRGLARRKEPEPFPRHPRSRVLAGQRFAEQEHQRAARAEDGWWSSDSLTYTYTGPAAHGLGLAAAEHGRLDPELPI